MLFAAIINIWHPRDAQQKSAPERIGGG